MIRDSVFFSIQLFIHTLSALVILSSTFAIMFILYILSKKKDLIKNSINIFFLNIIIIDLLKCIINIPIVNLSFHIFLGILKSYTINVATQRLIICNSDTVTSMFRGRSNIPRRTFALGLASFMILS